MTPCDACEAAAQRPTSGLYRAGCIECCARLVASTAPLKAHAQSMLAVLERSPAFPGLAPILARAAQRLGRRP